jgi:hypothetical protein
MHVRTTATELAQWLEHQGGHWHVEGEPALAKSLPLPTPAYSLVDALRRRRGDLAILVPDVSDFAPDSAVSAPDIASTAHIVDGLRVFQLAWLGDDGTAQDSWLLAEQRGQAKSKGGDNGAAAAKLIASFRARSK